MFVYGEATSSPDTYDRDDREGLAERRRAVGERQPGTACNANRMRRRATLSDRSRRGQHRSTAGRGAFSAHDSEDGVIIVGMVIEAADPGLIGRHDVREGRDRSECEDDEDTEREPQRRSACALRAVRHGRSSIWR